MLNYPKSKEKNEREQRKITMKEEKKKREVRKASRKKGEEWKCRDKSLCIHKREFLSTAEVLLCCKSV